ncbi:hypothetical protein PI125_g10660 [Phytophthora idaei]|nr:hypothetical protein PI125_g10660 [Phytophthora idaei]
MDGRVSTAWAPRPTTRTKLRRDTGLIPGNRQLDNTWETLRKYNHLVHANRSLQTDGIKAVLLKSFGFGQVSGELLVVHPDYLLSTLSVEDFQQSMVGASGAVMSTMMSRSGTSAPCQGVASV